VRRRKDMHDPGPPLQIPMLTSYRKLPLSNELDDHIKSEIIDQMQCKHPRHKTPITPLTNKELSRLIKGIDRAVFDKELKSFKHNIAPRLGCIQNKY
jgi:hypothetical protein